MILIITHKLDFTADFLVNILNKRNIAYKRFNCEDILTTDCIFNFTPGFSFSFLGEKYFKSVWFRRTMLPAIDMQSESHRKYIINEIDAFLKNIFSVIDAKWLSVPNAVYHAENKLYQLRIASRLGFNIPETLVTCTHSEVIDFYNKHKQVIVKPISHTRVSCMGNSEFIFTNKLTDQHIEYILSFDLTPCLFQREIKKKLELRVTVVKDKTFAAQVNSQEDEETLTDWRKKKLAFKVFELPNAIHKLCVELVKELNLLFGAIDLILSPDGTYTFLEINPNGQWVWIETETGLKISDAIIDELI